MTRVFPYINSQLLWLITVTALAVYIASQRHVLHLRAQQFVKGIANLLMPFAVIAAEMRRMNDLKELELSERINPFNGQHEPIVPVTEVPSRKDTEVFWGVEPQAHGKQALLDEFEHSIMAEIEDEDDE